MRKKNRGGGLALKSSVPLSSDYEFNLEIMS